MSKLSMQRWKEIRATTPSGRTMFVCMNCGRITDGPTEKCHTKSHYPKDVIEYDGTRRHVSVPCSLWPMTEDQYRDMNKNKFLFHGSVISPDGELRSVFIELDIEEVRELVAREAEVDFELSAEGAERSMKDAQEARLRNQVANVMRVAKQ